MRLLGMALKGGDMPSFSSCPLEQPLWALDERQTVSTLSGDLDDFLLFKREVNFYIA